MKQDLPPASGFQSIKYQRNIPSKGPSSIVALLGIAGFMGYGWYHFADGFKEKTELKREKAWLRISLLPFLQAETDRNSIRIINAAKARGYESPYKTELANSKLLPDVFPLNPEGLVYK